MACTITNHIPTGEYWLHFYPDLNNRCPTCPQHVQTCMHILFSCLCYVPLHSSLTNWSHDKDNTKSWKEFFTRNPSAFMFGDIPG